MKSARVFIAVVVGLSLFSAPRAGDAQAGGQTVDRVYALDCGELHLQDGGRVSPAMAGKPADLSNTCFLIRSRHGDLLWETGNADALVSTPAPKDTPLVLSRTRTLASQLADIGVRPSSIRYVAISHTHGDHAGNVDLFPGVTVLIQQAEYDSAFAAGRSAPFAATHPVEKVNGDKDVWGDGSVMLVSTPGHTPGHQSLLVNLKGTGWVLFAGDAVQIQDQWDRWRSSPETYNERLAPTMRRIAELVAKHNARVWFSHDPAQARQHRDAKVYE